MCIALSELLELLDSSSKIFAPDSIKASTTPAPIPLLPPQLGQSYFYSYM